MTLPRPSPCHALALLLGLASQACSVGAAPEDAGTGGGAGVDGGAGGANETSGAGGGGGSDGQPGGDRPGSRAGGHGDELDAASPPGKEDLPECQSGLPAVPFFLSADDSNSMASPVLAREMLDSGLAPAPAQIRTWEFLNYYNVLYDLPPAGAGELAVHTEMTPLGPSPRTGLPSFRLQIGVQAFEVPRPPMVVTFVVDASGSLVGPGIERERKALLAIGHQLRKGDVVNIVKWGADENVLLEKYVATGTEADDAALASAVNQLAPGGGSDLHGGLTTGYALAMAQLDPDKLNRVVLLSDGGANLGVVDRETIAKAAADAQAGGLYLVGIGVGPAQGYSDTLMDLVTDAGRGAYVYLDGAAEADAVFTDRFDEIMNVAAADVRVRVELPEYMEIEHFYGEKYSESPDLIEPQNLAPGDSMVLSQIVYLADPAAACGLDTVNVKVTWETPLGHEEREVDAPPLSLLDLTAAPPSRQMLKANAVIAYAEALKSGDPGELSAALGLVDEALAAGEDGDLAAIAALIQKHPAFPANP